MDYNLFTLSERLEYIYTNIDSIPPSQYEQVTNYLLHIAKPEISSSKKITTSKFLPLEESILQNIKTAKYTSPKQKLNWEDPFMAQYKIDIQWLKSEEEKAINQDNTELKYKLQQWRISHQLDAGLLQKSITSQIPSNPSINPINNLELNDFIDYTNSFHIKHIIDNYSALRQSDNSKLDIEYFDNLVEKAPLTDWQKHLLIKKIDGTSHINVGIEIAQLYGKILSPSYISQTMRTIYKQIAQQGEQEQLKWLYRNNPEKWRVCKKCNEKKLNNSFHWHKGANMCKICVKKAKQNKHI